MKEAREAEQQGESMMLELRANTRRLAKLIPQVPKQDALFEAQRLAIAIAWMMFDLADSSPDHFFKVWPYLEHDIRQAQAAVNLLRFRLAQPMVRRAIDDHLQN